MTYTCHIQKGGHTLNQDFYSSGQFARMAAVSIRTLHYYDEVGLLEPTRRNGAGHRLYNSADLARLQQILALKFLGFSLEEIRALLQAGPQRLEDVLAQQRAMLQERRDQINAVIEAIDEAAQLLRDNQCGWESVARVIRVMQMEQKQGWQEKYFTPEQRQKMQELSAQAYTEEARQKLATLHPKPWTEEDQKRVDAQYLFVKQELSRLVAAGADAASPDAQQVARTWDELQQGFTRGDKEIEASVGRWWEGFNTLPPEQRPFDASLYTYTEAEQNLLNSALAIYREAKS